MLEADLNAAIPRLPRTTSALQPLIDGLLEALEKAGIRVFRDGIGGNFGIHLFLQRQTSAYHPQACNGAHSRRALPIAWLH